MLSPFFWSSLDQAFFLALSAIFSGCLWDERNMSRLTAVLIFPHIFCIFCRFFFLHHHFLAKWSRTKKKKKQTKGVLLTTGHSLPSDCALSCALSARNSILAQGLGILNSLNNAAARRVWHRKSSRSSVDCAARWATIECQHLRPCPSPLRSDDKR